MIRLTPSGEPLRDGLLVRYGRQARIGRHVQVPELKKLGRERLIQTFRDVAKRLLVSQDLKREYRYELTGGQRRNACHLRSRRPATSLPKDQAPHGRNGKCERCKSNTPPPAHQIQLRSVNLGSVI